MVYVVYQLQVTFKLFKIRSIELTSIVYLKAVVAVSSILTLVNL